jgi:hypothetical protein
MMTRGLVLILTVGAAGPALAAPRTAALVPQLRPPAANELRDRFHEAVSRGLSQSGLETVPAAEVRLRLQVSEEQLNCAGTGICAARAALNLRTDKLVATEVVIAGKDYTIRLKLIDSAGREIGKLEEACEICTVKEADEAVTRAVTKLVSTHRAAIDAVTTPPPAPTPPPKVEPAPAPPPKVEPKPPAPTPATTEQPKPPVPDKKPVPWRWVAVGMLGVGVVGLAVGIPLIAIDGRPTCNPGNDPVTGMPRDPKRFCPEVYNTTAGGGIMTAVGIASLAASGVFWYLDWRQRRPPTAPKVSLVPLPEGGAFATVGGLF